MGARFVKLRMSLPLDGAAAPLPDGLLLPSPQREAEMTAFGAAMLAAMREALR